MKKRVVILTISGIMCLLSLAGFSQQAPAEEALGQQAEQAGRLREALTHYVTALQSAPDGSDTDQRLREKIIGLVPKLTPPPAVPDEATRYMGRGRAATEIAQSVDDFKKAAIEFQNALKVAPWLASGYFNLGVVQDRAGQYTEAIRSFKLYLLAAPSAPDSQDVQSRIAGLEYKQERQQEEARAAAQKRAAEEAAAAEKLRADEAASGRRVSLASILPGQLQRLRSLVGSWDVGNCGLSNLSSDFMAYREVITMKFGGNDEWVSGNIQATGFNTGYPRFGVRGAGDASDWGSLGYVESENREDVPEFRFWGEVFQDIFEMAISPVNANHYIGHSTIARNEDDLLRGGNTIRAYLFARRASGSGYDSLISNAVEMRPFCERLRKSRPGLSGWLQNLRNWAQR